MYYDSASLGYETQPPRDDDEDGTSTQHDRMFFILLTVGCTVCLIATFFLKSGDIFETVVVWSIRLCLGSVAAVCAWILHDWDSRW